VFRWNVWMSCSACFLKPRRGPGGKAKRKGRLNNKVKQALKMTVDFP
jgi:hypothetical protein